MEKLCFLKIKRNKAIAKMKEVKVEKRKTTKLQQGG